MNIRSLFREKPVLPTVVQTAGKKSHPFSEIDRYVPFSDAETRLYSSLREAIPIIDAAISKTVRLIGGFHVNCKDELSQKHIDRFVKDVQVGGFANGLDIFVERYLDSLLTYGTAAGEMVLSRDGRSIAGLYIADLDDIILRAGKNPLMPKIMIRSEEGAKPVKNPSLITVSALDPPPSSPYGKSILKGLPFVSSILLKIYNTTEINFDRVGNMRFAVTYRPQNDAVNVRERAEMIASEWSKAMKNTDGVSDFISVGDVDIKVIGADGKIIDTEVPVRQMLEQIVAKLGIPPCLLGLSWSTSERMSSVQCDILTSVLESYRRVLTPCIEKIAKTYLRLNALDDVLSIEWDNISLQDETELAKARLYNAQAEKIEEETRNGKN